MIGLSRSIGDYLSVRRHKKAIRLLRAQVRVQEQIIKNDEQIISGLKRIISINDSLHEMTAEQKMLDILSSPGCN